MQRSDERHALWDLCAVGGACCYGFTEIGLRISAPVPHVDTRLHVPVAWAVASWRAGQGCRVIPCDCPQPSTRWPLLDWRALGDTSRVRLALRNPEDLLALLAEVLSSAAT